MTRVGSQRHSKKKKKNKSKEYEPCELGRNFLVSCVRASLLSSVINCFLGKVSVAERAKKNTIRSTKFIIFSTHYSPSVNFRILLPVLTTSLRGHLVWPFGTVNQEYDAAGMKVHVENEAPCWGRTTNPSRRVTSLLVIPLPPVTSIQGHGKNSHGSTPLHVFLKRLFISLQHTALTM